MLSVDDAMLPSPDEPQVSITPQLIIDVLERKLGLLGRLIIDSTVNNRSLGGVRMMPDVGLNELTSLARNMTLKFGFWNIPMGGAKACVLISNKIPMKKRCRFLDSFGKNLAPLLRAEIYIPASDMGSSGLDIAYILAAAGCPWKPKKLKAHIYTSWTMYTSAEVAAAHIGMDISGSTVAIEGFGKVGASAAETFSHAGVRVVAVSTIEGAIYDPLGLDVAKMLELKERYGENLVARYPARKIGKSELFSLDVDIIAPCAGAWSLDLFNARNVKCRIVCPGANIPMSSEVEGFLHERGVLCIPDFVANSGGAFGGYLDSFVNERRIREVIQTNFRKQVQELIYRSQEKNATLGSIAREISWQRFQAMKTKAENKDTVFQSSWIRSLIRLLPKRITNSLAPLYFRKILDIN